MFDKDDSGAISVSELENVMHSLGVTKTEEELKAMIDKVDIDGRSGILGTEIFVNTFSVRMLTCASLYQRGFRWSYFI